MAKSRSNWWYVLPILLGVVGGLISYFIIRSDDRQKAKNTLYLGLTLTAIEIAVNVLFFGMFDSFSWAGSKTN